MNEIFCADRMWRYMKLYLVESRSTLLKYTGTMFAVLVFLLAIRPMISSPFRWMEVLAYSGVDVSAVDISWGKVMKMFWLALFVVLLNRGGNFFAVLGKKGSRIETLMVPASSFEKFCVMFLVNVVAFVVVFFIEFYIADLLRVALSPFYAPEGAKVALIPLSVLMGYSDGGNVQSLSAFLFFAITGLFSMQAYFALASAVWPKNGGLAGIGSLLAIGAVMVVLFFSGFATFVHSAAEPRAWIMNARGITEITLFTYGGVFNIMCILFFYALSFLRFKEIETINRW